MLLDEAVGCIENLSKPKAEASCQALRVTRQKTGHYTGARCVNTHLHLLFLPPPFPTPPGGFHSTSSCAKRVPSQPMRLAATWATSGDKATAATKGEDFLGVFGACGSERGRRSEGVFGGSNQFSTGKQLEC